MTSPTGTATAELVDLDVDYEATVPCTVVDCDNEGEWALHLNDCRHTLPVCSPCRDYLTEVAGLVDNPFITHKPRCTAKNYHWTWRPL